MKTTAEAVLGGKCSNCGSRIRGGGKTATFLDWGGAATRSGLCDVCVREVGVIGPSDKFLRRARRTA